MNRKKIHKKLDKTLDTIENTKSCIDNKLSLLANKVRRIVKPIGLNYQAFILAQKMGRASLYVEILEKIQKNVELSEMEQMIFDQMNRKLSNASVND
jgi:hypothetical protein|tara:strand:+ start:2493 stop:2783 length:291 start_codon:yes stop_codon:yes gene_type:complete